MATARSRCFPALRAAGLALALAIHAPLPGWAEDGAAAHGQVLSLIREGRYAQAEKLLRQILAAEEKAGRGHAPQTANYLNTLGYALKAQGRLEEAERAFRRGLAILEALHGAGHATTANLLNSLGQLLNERGRPDEAEPLLRRALALWEKEHGAGHPETAAALNNLALSREAQRDHAEAERLIKRVLAIRERELGPDHPDLAVPVNVLGFIYMGQGRAVEAEPLFRRALELSMAALGPDHPTVAKRLDNLAAALREQGRHVEAMRLMERSLAVFERAFGPEHPDVMINLNNIGWGYWGQQDVPKAYAAWQRAAALLLKRARLLSRGPGGSAEMRRELHEHRGVLAGLVRSAVWLAERDAARRVSLLNEAFVAGQWAETSAAAAALGQMAARFAAGSGALASLVRERQDAAAEWQKADKELIGALAQPPGRRDPAKERNLQARLADLERRTAQLDERLAREFPRYAALSHPRPLNIGEVQDDLRPNEAFVAFFRMGGDDVYAWAITKEGARLASVELPVSGEAQIVEGRVRVERRPALAGAVETLRCGLDSSAWADPSAWPDGSQAEKRQKDIQSARLERCRRLTGTSFPQNGLLPFDLETAHTLYKGLFGKIVGAVAGKELLIVPSGPLTSLPFAVLVTGPPRVKIGREAQDFEGVAWLGARQPIAVLPSAASLHALRRLAAATPAAPLPYLGIGNPLLDGDPVRARKARAWQTCADVGRTPVRRESVLAQLPLVGTLFRGGLADVAAIRQQMPLPETAEELCTVARTLEAPAGSVLLGREANEVRIKVLSADGGLSRARAVHFATHGLLAGETEAFLAARAEPGLILTPPSQASEADDGLLTASEVAQLRFNADWVVLSACNTAGGEKPGAEELSGLARSFFYAGARALLVSHWPVDSDAAVKLTTSVFARMRDGPRTGRAEALRQAMLALMTARARRAVPHAHPAVWAPFVVVGEGGR